MTSGGFLFGAGGLKFFEFAEGMAPGAFDGAAVTREVGVLFHGFVIGEDGEVTEFVVKLGFDAAGAI